MRYSNPFQFYLSVSIMFFLIFGLINSYNKFNELSSTTTKKNTSIADAAASINKKKVNVDSLKNELDKTLSNPFIPIDSITKKKIIDDIEKNAKDTTKTKGRISFGGGTRMDKFFEYNQKNPDVAVDEALDSLGYEKNFKNRFLYDRAKVSSSFTKGEGFKKFGEEMLSYTSISLFILLPIFTLFLKFFYIRRRFTYVDHLIFVFHTQTVFFLLLTLLVIVNFFTKNVEPWLFIVLFLIYLYIAMKRFYNQGYFKTFFKFCFVNLSYLFLATIGAAILAIGSFAFYQG